MTITFSRIPEQPWDKFRSPRSTKPYEYQVVPLKRAREFLILRAARSAEVRKAIWAEIDMDGSTTTRRAGSSSVEKLCCISGGTIA